MDVAKCGICMMDLKPMPVTLSGKSSPNYIFYLFPDKDGRSNSITCGKCCDTMYYFTMSPVDEKTDRQTKYAIGITLFTGVLIQDETHYETHYEIEDGKLLSKRKVNKAK